MKNSLKKEAKKLICELKDAIAIQASAKKRDEIIVFECYKNSARRLIAKNRKRINSSKPYKIFDDNVCNEYGQKINAIPAWIGTIEVEIIDVLQRYKTLLIFHQNKYYLFCIPTVILNKPFKLSKLGFEADDSKFLCQIASDTSQNTEYIQIYHKLKHPAKLYINYQKEQFTELPDNTEFLNLILKYPCVLDCILPVIDAQIRGIKSLKLAPVGLYNFTVKNGNLQVISQAKDIITSANFAYSTNYANARPIEKQLTEKNPLPFEEYYDRIVLGYTSSSTALDKLYTVIDEREEQRSIGGKLPDRLPSIPILINKKFSANRHAYNIEFDDSLSELDSCTLNLIRVTCKSIINKSIAQSVYDTWMYRMSSPYSYNTPVFDKWVNTLKQVILYTLADEDDNLQNLVDDILGKMQEQKLVDEEDRKQRIQEAIDKIKDTDNYSDKIISRPKTKAIAVDKLSDEAYAFWFVPAKGNDQDRKLLAFSKNSLLRFLKAHGLDEILYELFLKKADSIGILHNKNHSITLSGETFNAITFYA